MSKRTVSVVAFLGISAGLSSIILMLAGINEQRTLSLEGIVILSKTHNESSLRVSKFYVLRAPDGHTITYSTGAEFTELKVGDRIAKKPGKFSYTINGQQRHFDVRFDFALVALGIFYLLCGIVAASIAVFGFKNRT